MDEVLHTLIADHLNDLFATIEDVAETGPDHLARRRAAYRMAILDQDGALLPAHHLLLRQTINLADDLQQDVAEIVAELGNVLAPSAGKFALMLLDDPDLPLAEAEQYITLKLGRAAASAAPARSADRPVASAPRPMVAIARTLSRPAFMQALDQEEMPIAVAPQLARAGP
jgi:hypothetical protein